MIKKIEHIQNFRIFNNWKPEPTCGDFQKINIIYGVNGSGKSTFANVMANAIRDTSWESGLGLTVINDTGDRLIINAYGNTFWDNVRIFNKQFITENLLFDEEGTSSAVPLLSLGKESIDREKQIGILQDRLVEIQIDQTRLSIAIDKATLTQDKLAKDESLRIIREFGKLGGRYNPRIYDIRNVKALVVQQLEVLSDDALSAEFETVNSNNYLEIKVSEPGLVPIEPLIQRINEIATRLASGFVIETLREDKDLSDWVQAGIGLHKSGDNCAFCDNPVDSSRWETLGSHFDKAFINLQSDARNIRFELDSLLSVVHSFVNSLPEVGELVPNFRNEYLVASKDLEIRFGEIETLIGKLKHVLTLKESNPFSIIEVVQIDTPSVSAEISSLVSIIDNHNRDLAKSSDRVLEAASRIESSWIALIQPEYGGYSTEIELAQSQRQTNELERIEKNKSLESLKNQVLDPAPLAEVLNEDLSRLLGRQSFKFITQGDGNYQIQRAGSPALFLSDGERTAISLLYFIRSLGTHRSVPSKQIVIIDDPISSLDANIAIGLSSYLWSKLVGKNESGEDKCAQVFLLTHNFELFRSWTNSLDRLNSNVQRTQGITQLAQELRVRSKIETSGEISWHPYFYPWPMDADFRKRIRSEYHYLFWRLATSLRNCQNDPSPETDIDAAAILPNVCRRLLEGFLSFRFPEKIGNFRAQVMLAIDSLGESTTRTHIVNFLNQYSHNESSEFSAAIARPESIKILESVFSLIRQVDPGHYASMFNSLELEPFET